MKRRTFLGMAASALGAPAIRIIDTHIHLFDTARPGGVPWPPKDNTVLYKPALPERYAAIARPLGVEGAIAVEASPWDTDNEWLLETAGRSPLLVGVVGDLEPADAGFAARLEKLRRNPLFLGIRYGNLWDRDLGKSLEKPAFVDGLKRLAAAGLTLDTANPNEQLLGQILRVSDAVPDLRIVIDHLPQMTPTGNMHELRGRPHMWVKVSEVLRRENGAVSEDLSFYRDRLDRIFDLVGENRVLYGSDWPNSDIWAPYGTVLRVVREYFESKGPKVAEKYFRTNSMAAYRWKARKTTTG